LIFGTLMVNGHPDPIGTENGTNTDVDILNFALTLEHIEYAFYNGGVSLLAKNKSNHNLRGNNNSLWSLLDVYGRLLEILDHERIHVQSINNTINKLGGTPVAACIYDFGYKTAVEFLAIGRIFENVGVSAYTGAIASIENSAIVTAAATIATIEARHASYLNVVNGLDPFPTPFDSPLDMRAVFGLASAFIVSCPQNISIVPYPTVVATPSIAAPNDTLKIKGTFSLPQSGPAYCVFYAGSISLNSPLNVKQSDNTTSCEVPAGVYGGDNFLFITTTGVYDATNNSGILGGPALIIIINSLFA